MGRPRTPVLFGRASETGMLRDALAETAGGTGRLVLVGGEPGAGKTRLLDEFERTSGARCVRGHWVDGGADALPYGAWIELLSSLVRELGDAFAGDARAELRRLLNDLDGEAHDARRDGRALMFQAVVDLLERGGSGGPLVCMLEDLHWVDPASRELLLTVTRRLHRVPVLLVVTYRNEQQLADLRHLVSELQRSGATRIELARLSGEDAAAMIELLTSGSLDAVAAGRIAERSEGNPLFIEELVHASDATLPISLRDLLLARCNRLGADARKLVDTAAVIGAHA